MTMIVLPDITEPSFEYIKPKLRDYIGLPFYGMKYITGDRFFITNAYDDYTDEVMDTHGFTVPRNMPTYPTLKEQGVIHFIRNAKHRLTLCGVMTYDGTFFAESLWSIKDQGFYDEDAMHEYLKVNGIQCLPILYTFIFDGSFDWTDDALLVRPVELVENLNDLPSGRLSFIVEGE